MKYCNIHNTNDCQKCMFDELAKKLMMNDDNNSARLIEAIYNSSKVSKKANELTKPLFISMSISVFCASILVIDIVLRLVA